MRILVPSAATLGGTLPINTSGGLVSKGHPIAATGLSMTYEIATQLRGEAGERQVDGARIGVIGHSLGGHNAIFTAAFAWSISSRVRGTGSRIRPLT